MNQAMAAIIKKDFRGIVSNRRFFTELLIVPLILTIVLPSISLAAVHFAPDDPDILKLLQLLPGGIRGNSLEMTVAGLIFNYILPVFFLMIPVMTASIMSASSFVGEKEKHTLETLFYCPLSVKQIFQAKVLASFLLSMMVSLISFAAMVIVLEVEAVFLMGNLLAPAVNWLVIPSSAFSRCFADRSDSDCERISQGPERGGIPAERCLSHYSDNSAGGGAVHGNHAAECVDPAGNKPDLCTAGMDSAEEGGRQIYV